MLFVFYTNGHLSVLEGNLRWKVDMQNKTRAALVGVGEVGVPPA